MNLFHAVLMLTALTISGTTCLLFLEWRVYRQPILLAGSIELGLVALVLFTYIGWPGGASL